MPKNNHKISIKNELTEFLLYTAPSGKVKVEIYFHDENIWLTQDKMVKLFSVQRPAIAKHLKNIFESGELLENVEKTSGIQSLHEMVMTKLKPFLSYDITIDMVFSPPTVEEITFYWIKNYADKSSFENFKPHITVGFGELGDVDAPIAFTASTLALCHLGNYCTCRKVLFSAKLTE